MKRIHLFAVDSDWIPVFDHLQTKHSVLYTSMNDQYLADAPVFNDAKSIPSFGIATSEQTNGCNSYLVTHSPTQATVHRFKQNDGRERFDIEMGYSSVRLVQAGRWKDMIIAGVIDTMSDDPLAQSLMRGFHTPIKKHFTRVNAFWVGPQAHNEWLKGRRLTSAEQSPPLYDLRKV